MWVPSPFGVLWKLCLGNCYSTSHPLQHIYLLKWVWLGGSWSIVIYRAEPIIQTHFPLSADQLYKKWRLIRNLKQLAHFSNLGDACNFITNISLQTGSTGCFISVFSSPSVARLQFALMRTAHVHQVESSRVAAAFRKG